jgi:hypothetical protein
VRYDRWLARLFPAAKALGVWPRLESAIAAMLAVGTEADQQRRWKNNGGSFEGLVKTLADATAQPWSASSSPEKIKATAF